MMRPRCGGKPRKDTPADRRLRENKDRPLYQPPLPKGVPVPVPLTKPVEPKK